MFSRFSQRHEKRSAADKPLPDEPWPVAQLLEAERDEQSLLQHLHRVQDYKALQALRRVRQRIAYWREHLRTR